MPGGNRTGPQGQGPMTGRRMGSCIDNDYPGAGTYFRAGRGFGRGFRGGFASGKGMGFGFRYGFRNPYPENIPDVSEKTIIENEIRILKDQLSYLEKQLSKPGEE